MDINRKLAYKILYDIEAKKMYSNIALNNGLNNREDIKEAFIRELVYGTLENKLYLEFVASSLVKGRLKDVPRQGRIILIIALYQMIFMNGIEDYGAVNEAVELAKKVIKPKVSLINGVLRAYNEKKDTIEAKLNKIKEEDFTKYLSIKYSVEKYIVEFIIRDFGSNRVEAILKALNRRPNIYIRTNILKTNRQDLCQTLEDEGFATEVIEDSTTAIKVVGSSLTKSKAFKEGLFSIQDRASQKLIDILDPEPGDMIIDLCAAPGGKSFAAAERMENKGHISSRDIYEHKLKIINDEKLRLGIENLSTILWNGEELDKEALGKYSKVICDVPCSGFGVISRKPEIKYKKAYEDILELPKKQLKILENASRYLDDKGVLIYSTCTINKDENQKVVNEFLKRNKAFVLEKEVLLMPDEMDIDGFYIAKLKREGELW